MNSVNTVDRWLSLCIYGREHEEMLQMNKWFPNKETCLISPSGAQRLSMRLLSCSTRSLWQWSLCSSNKRTKWAFCSSDSRENTSSKMRNTSLLLVLCFSFVITTGGVRGFLLLIDVSVFWRIISKITNRCCHWQVCELEGGFLLGRPVLTQRERRGQIYQSALWSGGIINTHIITIKDELHSQKRSLLL